MRVENVVNVYYSAEDLVGFVRGHLREISTPDGLKIRMMGEEGLSIHAITHTRVAQNSEPQNGGPLALPAAPARPKRVTLSNQRGTCPYCKTPDILIAAHIRQQHPGKAVPWLGEGGVKCKHCKRMFPSQMSITIHMNQANGAFAAKKGEKKK